MSESLSNPAIERVRRWFLRHVITYAVAMSAGAFVLIFFRPMFTNPAVLLTAMIWGTVLLGHWLLTRQIIDIARGSEAPLKRNAYRSMTPAVRLRVEEALRLQQRQEQHRWFRVGLATMLASILIAWIGIPALMGPFGVNMNSVIASLFTFTLGLLLGAFFHWRGYRVTSDEATRALRDQLVGRLIQEEWDAGVDSEKAKHTLTLSDDGELVEVEADYSESEKRKQAYE